MVLHGDSLEILKDLPDNSVDTVVTDPPYGLSFMGKKWDYDVPSTELWREVLRVLKPGGHLLSFGGTRTYHRMVVAIEDAGFDIRDQIMWIYGSGFPKSLDVSKAIDKAAGAEREVIGSKLGQPGYSLAANDTQDHSRGAYGKFTDASAECSITAPATDAAKQWQGWGTALKPANEPIVLARKPLEKGLTVAQNVQKWGTGALNIDGTRIESVRPAAKFTLPDIRGDAFNADNSEKPRLEHSQAENLGRWPANVLFDEEAAAMLDAQSGERGVSKGGSRGGKRNQSFGMGAQDIPLGFGDSGGASRFFYVAKASKRERNAGLDKNDLTWDEDIWQKQDLNSLMVSINQLVRAISAGQLMDARQWSTAMFGNHQTDPSQQTVISTISTVLKMITDLKTLNVSPNSNTKENILAALKTIKANGLSPAETVAELSSLIPSFTNEKTVSALGAVNAVLTTLSKINAAAKSGNFHSTVKPVKLMEYLIKLVCPPGGIVLDPFMGSGTTGVAAVQLGVEFIGIEREAEYVAIAEKRIEAAV